MGDWESIFREKGKFFSLPYENMGKIVKLMKKYKIKRVLDLGCGSGRNTLYLAKNGFDVYGMDNSKSGLRYTKECLIKSNLKAKLKNASCYKRFPYKNNFFDAVISIQVIHHAKIDEIKFCISEIERILKPDGLVFITVPKAKKNKFRSKVKMIAPRTFIPLDGIETGLPHYHFSKDLFKKSLKNFRILNLYTDRYNHYCFIGKIKKRND
jgi:cyclopropane fatty-acyl-phospholipid synthase-like methyltransferase